MGGGTEVIELCGGPCNSHESRKLTFVSKTGHLLDALTSPHVCTDALLGDRLDTSFLYNIYVR